MLSLSVIIATCGRPERLRVTLEHVLLAAERVGGCKVIVVDNHPDYAAEAVVRRQRSEDRGQRTEIRGQGAEGRASDLRLPTSDLASPITYLRSPPYNKAKALNAGIAAADTEWMAFTDDDTLPQEDWLARGMRYAGEEGVRVFGGRVLPEEVTQVVPAWMRPGRSGRVPHIGVIVCHDPLEVSGVIGPSDPAPFGANVFVRRDVFAAHGGYDEELWELCRTHWPLGSEDSEFGHRLKLRGERIGYCREAVVVHPVNYDRVSLCLHIRRAFCEGWRQPLIFIDEQRRAIELFRFRIMVRLAAGCGKDMALGDVSGAAERLVEVARCWGAVVGRWSRAYRVKSETFIGR